MRSGDPGRKPGDASPDAEIVLENGGFPLLPRTTLGARQPPRANLATGAEMETKVFELAEMSGSRPLDGGKWTLEAEADLA
jgi:hypothetical protein